MFALAPLVSSTRLTSVNWTVIGGLQSGWNVAVSERVPSALPFCTGKSPAELTLSLFTAFGCLPPLLMHSAVALSTTWTCASLPSPASLKLTVRVFPSREASAVTKCGFPANAICAIMAIPRNRPTASPAKPFGWGLRCLGAYPIIAILLRTLGSLQPPASESLGAPPEASSDPSRSDTSSRVMGGRHRPWTGIRKRHQREGNRNRHHGRPLDHLPPPFDLDEAGKVRADRRGDRSIPHLGEEAAPHE